MTYAETTVGQTIGRLLSERPDLDPSADGALDNLDQFHIGGADAVGLLIGSLALAEGHRVLDIDLRERPARRTGAADAPRRRLHPSHQRHRRPRQRLP
jgi:hypothetical protein